MSILGFEIGDSYQGSMDISNTDILKYMYPHIVLTHVLILYTFELLLSQTMDISK